MIIRTKILESVKLLLKKQNVRSIIDLQNGRAVKCTTGGITMNERTEIVPEMTNEEYRIELDRMFEELDDNRLLRYFYVFVSEKIKSAQ